MFLTRLREIKHEHLPPPSVDDPVPFELRCDQDSSDGVVQRKYLVIIHHDESTFHANDDEVRMWGEPDSHMIRPKSKGASLMVSDFVEEFGGFLRLSDDEYGSIPEDREKPSKKEARVILQYGAEREGYWNNQKFMVQVGLAEQIANIKYPSSHYSLLWLFDQSSGHTAMAADALVASRMNVGDGGAQPRMYDTVRPGGQLLTEDGTAKGLRTVLIERGINCVTLKKEDMVKILSQHDDFRDEKTILESFLLAKGHYVMFFPIPLRIK